MGLWRGLAVLALVPLGAATTASCGGCDKKMCLQPGVYLYIGKLKGATTADVCIDDECHTVAVEPRPDEAGIDEEATLYASDMRDLPANKKVHLVVTISDGTATLATLDKKVTIPAGVSACSCSALSYHWDGDSFERYT